MLRGSGYCGKCFIQRAVGCSIVGRGDNTLLTQSPGKLYLLEFSPQGGLEIGCGICLELKVEGLEI